jgi:hypothetical protein
MNYCLKSLLLLAALPLCVAAMNQEATASDRFDVKVEVLEFFSYRDTDPSGFVVDYKYIFVADIEGAGRRRIDSRIITRPRFLMPVGRTVQFNNIKKPKNKDRHFRLSAYVTGRYGLVDGTKKVQHQGLATDVIKRDLFREADRSRDDKAVQTFSIGNPDYMMTVRVTVVEVD